MIEFITTLIILSIGFVIGAYTFNIPTKWNKWEDITIVYEDYTFSLLQVRSNNKGDKEFRKIKIVKYADLSTDQLESIAGILQNLKTNNTKQNS